MALQNESGSPLKPATLWDNFERGRFQVSLSMAIKNATKKYKKDSLE